MKHKVYLLALILLLTPFLIFSQTVLVNDDFNSMNGWRASYGNWKIVDGRLAQLSTTAGKAKIDRYVPQSGLMQYEFNVHYIDGGLDSYAGFGIHVFIDKPAKGIFYPHLVALAHADHRGELLQNPYAECKKILPARNHDHGQGLKRIIRIKAHPDRRGPVFRRGNGARCNIMQKRPQTCFKEL